MSTKSFERINISINEKEDYQDIFQCRTLTLIHRKRKIRSRTEA